MRWHLLAFSGAKTDSTANENIPAVSDAGWSLSNANEYLLPQNLEVMFAYALNDTITRARITSQNLRDIGYPEVYPLQVAATPTAPLPVAAFAPNAMPKLKLNDTVGFQCSNGVSTVDEARACIAVRPSMFPAPPGARTTLYASASVTLVKDQWVSKTLTYDQTPPVGRYSVIGMEAYGTNAVFARLIFPGYTEMRPGVVAGNTIAEYDPRHLNRGGYWGEWGQFYSVNLPQIEVLGDTAGAQTINVILDVVALDY